jgi:hypothetical protein
MPDDFTLDGKPVYVLTEGRPVTLGEFEDGWAVFGDSVPYPDVEIVAVDSAADFAMMVQGEDGLKIYAKEEYYYDDFSKAPNWERSVLIHEMTHVFQHENPAFVDWAKAENDLAANGGDFRKLYDYQLAPGSDFLKDFNHEQQADIVQDYFHSSLDGASEDGKTVVRKDYESVLPFDQFGGERARVPVIAPVNEDGSPTNTASPREPIVAPINEDGSPLGSQPPASPTPSQAGLNNPGPSTVPNAELGDPEVLTLSEEDALSPSPSQPESSLEPATPPPAATAEPAAAPKPSAEPPAPQPEPEPQGPTLAELLGDDYTDPNEEGAATEDSPPSEEELRDIYNPPPPEEDDDDDEQGAGGSSNEMPNPVDDGPSYSNGDYVQLLNRNAPYVNPGSGGIDMAIVGDIDPSVLLNRNAPYVNPGSEDFFDVTAGGSGDYTVLLNRNAPYVNPGLGDIDMPVGDVDLSVLLNRNGPRQTFGPDDADLANSPAGGLLSDIDDIALDLDGFAGFEIG